MSIQMPKRIKALYFSPTGSTKEIVAHLAQELSAGLNIPYEEISYTLPCEREEKQKFSADDLVIWGTPVYAGRIPNKTLEYVSSAIEGNQALAIPVVVYGNRSFDDALAELGKIMKQSGCNLLAAAAVIARHTFSQTLAAGRPNADDKNKLTEFCQLIVDKIVNKKEFTPLGIPGDAFTSQYYTPLQENGEKAIFLKAKPVVDETLCTGCQSCVAKCPMGSISFDEGPGFAGICIKCQACVRNCARHAISFTDEQFLSHVRMVEKNYSEPKEIALFL